MKITLALILSVCFLTSKAQDGTIQVRKAPEITLEGIWKTPRKREGDILWSFKDDCQFETFVVIEYWNKDSLFSDKKGEWWLSGDSITIIVYGEMEASRWKSFSEPRYYKYVVSQTTDGWQFRWKGLQNYFPGIMLTPWKPEED